MAKKAGLLLLLLLVPVSWWGEAAAEEPVAEDLSWREVRSGVRLDDHWRFHSEDLPGLEDPDLDDRSWEEIEAPHLVGRPEGIVWFRLHVNVDESLWERQIALLVNLRGAAELYLNGRLLYRYGTVEPLAPGARSDAGDRLRTFTFPARPGQVIAVRYNGNPVQGFDWIDFGSGFEMRLGELETMFRSHARRVRSASAHQMVFVGAFAGQALMHLLLFLFYPRFRANLYFALTTGFSAILVAVQFERVLSNDPAVLSFAFRIWGPILVLTMVALMRFAYSLFYTRAPRYFWLLAGMGLLLIAVSWYRPRLDAFFDFWWFHLIALAETLRVSLLAISRRRRGAWIIAFGLGGLTLGLVVQFLAGIRVLEQPYEIFPVAYYGVAVLLFSMSVYLAHDFASTNRDLEAQLEQVKDLSRKTLLQERQAREQEIQQRLLEADNARKTEELEAARQLQLSLLPTVIPHHPDLEIAVHMQPATEVGGDYYDFHVGEDGALTVALGDATGHGAKAGTMVSVMKGLFSALAGENDLRLFLDESTRAIRRMNLGLMHMAMGVVRVDGRQLTYSAAGMPPIFVYRSRTGTVDEVQLEGMPLGGIPNFRYEEKSVPLGSGDAVLLTSDGFPELQSAGGELFGYARCRDTFARGAAGSPREIVDHLTAAAHSWTDGSPLGDDITFVVLKMGRRG